MCPHCGRDAPILYRGAVPYCTACGGLRLPLSGSSLNLAGKPSKVGGAVARVAGWVVLLVGLSAALGAGLVLNALGTAAVALAISLPVALVAAVAGIALVTSGRSLSRSGADIERTTREQALIALASHRGAVTAGEAAVALGVTVAEADAMLTVMAKREPERLTVDIDDQGAVWYRAVGPVPVAGARVRVGEGVRLDDAAGTGEEVETDDEAERAEIRR
jgi:hypothetical protein